MTAPTTDTPAATSARVLAEGYGPGAWHGPDLKAAFDGVTDELAFWRPGAGRHNIAEIALHHAYTARNVLGKITGSDPGPFVLEGADWFEVSDGSRVSWRQIQALVDREHNRLAVAETDVASGRLKSPLPPSERFDLILGITCHAVYHAGQIQLIKRLQQA
jgi:DinB superfamily